ncbi:Ig-like domain-containing protein [Flagellimonas crocea]|uniref:Ig-like domain-containing protein n=1 Tax=Flagellimonas crocea TaxID=3067311 RepID=UPI00296F3168|nr:Ig-like domain-containing protein [Muricauda sp. DH64]
MKLTNLNYLILFYALLLFSCSSDSDDPNSEPDTVAPTVDFTIAGVPDSENSQTVVVSSQIQINVDAEDERGIAKVEAFINGEKVGEDTTAPYQITIDISGFASKTAGTSKFQDYVLKILATDTSGNETSKEQVINIDNEIPVISNISISENTIIGGDLNEVTFDIEENQGLESVEIYLNNQLYQELDTDSFSFNLQTSGLTDGANTLKIVARDLADNIALFEVPFISDNTGPVIDLNSIEANQILDKPIVLSTSLTDEYSTVTHIEILLTDIEILTAAVEFTASTEGIVELLDFDPNQYPTGPGTFKIIAKDALLNTTELEIPVTILRRLLEVNIPANYFQNNLEVILFLSKLDGSLLDESIVSQDEQQIVFRTALDLEPEDKMMLTFALNSPSYNNDFARFYSISDIDINVLPIINLDYKPILEHSYEYYQASGFTTDDRHAVRAASTKYQGNLVWDDSNRFQFYNMDCSTCPAYEMENYYFIILDSDTQPYQYTWIPAPIDDNTVLDKRNFTTAGIEQRFVQAYNLPSSNYQLHLQILGYLNEEEFIGDNYHLMDENSISYWEVGPNGIGYNYNDDFKSYATKIKLRNYQPSTQGYQLTSFGSVIESFTVPEWTVDWVETNREITINKSSSGDILGKIELGIDNHGDENFVPYDWNIIFNSAETSSVKIPELPETIKSWDFYTHFVEKALFIQQVDIKKYEGISNYDDYLQKVIKDNKSPHLASPRIESVFNRNPLATSDSYDYFYWLFD